MCRGLILDADGAIVARPFAKFFNYGDPQAVIPVGETHDVTDKFDGSLGILYYLDGDPYLATRGSFTSEQAIEGTLMLREQELGPSDGTTPLFEIVYPENRIVVDYGGDRQCVLLAAIDNQTGRDATPPAYSGDQVLRHGPLDIAGLAELAQPNREGFVVTFEGGTRIKVKFAEYVRLHKLVTGINARAVWEAMRQGDDLDSLLEGVPDEIYQWVSETRDQLQRDHVDVHDAALTVFENRPPDADRKTLAGYFQDASANTAVLFRMLDGKPYEDLIWKAIRPEPNTPQTRWTDG